jgi:hypothetical protein
MQTGIPTLPISAANVNCEDDNAVVKTVETYLRQLDGYINVNANKMILNLHGGFSVLLHTNYNRTDIIILQKVLFFVGRNQFPGYKEDVTNIIIPNMITISSGIDLNNLESRLTTSESGSGS